MSDPQTHDYPASLSKVPSNPLTPTISDRDRLDYYWKHFALIADQRVKTFNFYIIVLLASFGASVGAFKMELPRHLYCLIGTGHTIVVISFWMIEKRGGEILKIARTALCEIERGFGEGYKPMTIEQSDRRKIITYGHAFRILFVVHLLFGLLIAAFPSMFIIASPK